MQAHARSTVLGCFLAAASLSLAALPASAQALRGTLKKIADRGEIVLGHRDAAIPFSYLDGSGRPVGFSLDLCQSVVEAVKRRLGRPDLKVSTVPVTSATRIPLVANGTVDLECGSTTNTVARQSQVAFSVTTFVAAGRLLVKRHAGVAGIADLKGRAVAANQGSNPVRALLALNTGQHLGIRFLPAKDFAESFVLLETDRAAAIPQDDVLLAGLRANARNPDDYAIVGAPFTVEPYGLVLPREDPDYKALVDGVLIAMMRDGRFEKLYDKWFTQPIPPRGINLHMPMSETLREKLRMPDDRGVQ